MAFLPGLFGGDNQVGFFGGGRYRPDDSNFNLPQLDQMQQAYGNAAQQQLGAINPQQGNDFRNQQQGLATSLFGTINGAGPSVAQQQLQQTTQGNVANAYAMAAAGGNNPAAARMAAMNAGNINQQAAGQGALLRAQEVQGAQGMLGNVLGGARGQDQAGQGMAIQGAQGFLGGLQNVNTNQANARMAYDAANQQGFSGAQQNAVGGKVLSAAGGVAGAMMPLLQHKAQGGLIEGYAAGGDSEANDTVPAMLSPGEIVLPRSITEGKGAAKKAALFVEAIKARHARKRAA